MTTLVSRPSMLTARRLLGEWFTREEIAKPSDTQVPTEAINAMMAAICGGAGGLLALLKKKANVYAQIQAKLDLLRHAKVSLTEEQIRSFSKLMAASGEKSAELSHTMQKIRANKDLKSVKKELLHSDADYDLVLNELSALYHLQQAAIVTLESIIEDGHGMLVLLQENSPSA